jgi:hypothetical protein
MFIGHLGVGLAVKRVAPLPALGTTLLAAQWADGIWPVLVLLGVEHVEIAPGITKVTPLDFVSYPYSHSLIADIGWAALFAIVYGTLRKDWPGAFWLALVVLSHWVLDVIAQIEARRASAIEQRDLGRVADAEQAMLQRDGVVDPKPPYRVLGHRRREIVMGHRVFLQTATAGTRCRSIQ